MEPDLTTEELLAALSTNPADRVSLPSDNLMSTERFQDQASFELPPEQLATIPGVPMPGPVPPDVTVVGQQIPGRLVDPELAQLYGGPSEAFLDPLNRFTAPPGLERPPVDRFEGVRELAEKTRRAAFFSSPEVKEARARFDQAEKDLKNVEIDPFSFVKDGKSKAMAIVGLVLGEAARGFSGGKLGNVASDLLFKFADMEMKKGIEKKGKLRDLFNMANQRLGNEIAASNMVRDALVRGYQTQLDLGLREMAMEDAAANAAAQIAKDLQISRQKNEAASNEAARKKQERLLPSGKEARAALSRAQQSLSTASSLGTAIQGIEKMTGKPTAELEEEDLDGLDVVLDAMARGYATNDSPAITAALAQVSDRVKGAVQLNNAINAIAFGLASQGQSASAISDRDVQIFKDILADPKINAAKVNKFLRHLQIKARASQFYEEAIGSGTMAPMDAENAARARMKQEFNIDYDSNYGYLSAFATEQKQKEDPRMMELMREFRVDG
jgi:hypothetical protein